MSQFDWGTVDQGLRGRRARSFGAAATTYDEHRPDYPISGVRWALEPVAADKVRVLDLAAGTGKLTGVILAAGAQPTAVEPDDGMRAVLADRYPEVTALAGTAESIPLPDDSMDAVLVGQALHWFDLSRAFPEIARVLRPGGVLAAFWNEPDDSVEWVAGLERVSRSDASFPPAQQPDLPSHARFSAFETATFPHSHRRTVESLTSTIGTHSHALVISPADRAALLDRIAAYLRSRPETADGPFEMPLRTLVIRSAVTPLP
ncbi:class I SAM-dependent methyltransferase [Nocardia sp. NPDC059240]|uniref:class I SAM-dependent methyltransferase n=1 Tax=Nocardia sp. NPDC059240 TaxID=3346786 RepID=UPI0036BFE401